MQTQIEQQELLPLFTEPELFQMQELARIRSALRESGAALAAWFRCAGFEEVSIESGSKPLAETFLDQLSAVALIDSGCYEEAQGADATEQLAWIVFAGETAQSMHLGSLPEPVSAHQKLFEWTLDHCYSEASAEAWLRWNAIEASHFLSSGWPAEVLSKLAQLLLKNGSLSFETVDEIIQSEPLDAVTLQELFEAQEQFAGREKQSEVVVS